MSGAAAALRRRLFGLLALLPLLPALWLRVEGVTRTLPLEPAAMAPERGHAFYVPVPRMRLFWLERDRHAAPAASRAVLLEDGRPVGAPHAPHDDIRAHGAGRYSHWENALYFSTPDGSDPRGNGRRYALRGQFRLQPWVLHVAIGFAVLGLALLVPWRRLGGAGPRAPQAVAGAARAALRLARIARPGGLQIALALGTVPLALAGGEIYLRWSVPFWRQELPFLVRDGMVAYRPGATVRSTNLIDFWVESRVNSLGFVDAEPRPPVAGECRIAIVGDSFVDALQVPVADKVQRRLEELLRGAGPMPAVVQGFGVSGTGQTAQLVVYDRVVRAWRPDVAVLVLVHNDFTNNSAILEALSHGWHPEHPAFQTFREVDGRVVAVPRDPGYSAHLPRVPLPEPRAAHRWLSANSLLYGWLLGHAAVRHPATVAAWTRVPAFTDVLAARVAALRALPGYGDAFEGWRLPDDLSNESMFYAETMPPLFERALRETAAALREWRARADRDRFALVALAVHSMSFEGRSEQAGRLTDGGLYLRRFTDLAAAAGIEVLDQRRYARERGLDLSGLTFSRDGHWNPLGHRAAAELLRDRLRRAPGLCPGTAAE